MKKSSGGRARAAVGFGTDGVGIACVARSPDLPPVLEACDFAEVPDAARWGDAVGVLARRHAARDRACSVVLSEGAYTLLLVEAPEVPPDELKAAVRWRIRELIDFHVDDAVVDLFDLPPRKGGGRARMMYVAAARAPRVGAQAAAVQGAGLRLDVVDIPELAQRNIAAELPEDVGGVALVRLGPGSGLLTLTRQGVLYLARRFDLGTDSLPPGAPGDTESVSAWLDGLVVEVQRSLDYFESNFGQAPIAHLVVAPLARATPGMADYLGSQLGVGTRLLDLNTVVDSAQPVAPEIQARCFDLVGAALRVDEVSL